MSSMTYRLRSEPFSGYSPKPIAPAKGPTAWLITVRLSGAPSSDCAKPSGDHWETTMCHSPAFQPLSEPPPGARAVTRRPSCECVS